MKKIFGIALLLAVVASLAFGSVALADDPTVSISGSTDKIDAGVTGTFSTGTLSWILDATTGTHTATTTFTGITNGNFVADATGKNSLPYAAYPGPAGTQPYQPVGAIGATNTFTAIGNFAGTYQNTATGSYGNLSSYINASGSAYLSMENVAYLDVLSANHEYGLVGYFLAEAFGTNAAMNLKSINWGASPGGWQEATNGGVALQGQYIEKMLALDKNAVLIAGIGLSVNTTGTATMSNSNTWGWGISEGGGSGNATTNYNGGTRTVSATGTGTYDQFGAGANYLDFNGFTLPAGGSMSVIADFVGGISGTYSMNAH